MRPRLLALLVAVALLAAACTDGTAGVEEAEVLPPTTTTSPPLPPLEGPAEVRVVEGPHSVLTALVTVRSQEPVRPRLVARSADHEVVVPRPPEAVTDLEIPLAGLRAETTYRLQVTGSPELVRASRGLRFTTGALPDSLPPVRADTSPLARPGITLINASPSATDLPRPGKLIGVDHEGHVVWYLEGSQNMADVRQLPNGNIIFNFGNVGAREVDVLGRVVREWTTDRRVRRGVEDSEGRVTYRDGAIVLETPRLHHEVAHPLPNGNYLSLSLEIREVDGFPDDLCGEDDPFPDGPRLIRGDVILEFTPEGEIVHQLSLLDSLDPVTQQGTAMCDTRTDELVAADNEFVDWTHANSAELFEEDNVVLVSARNINSVLALRWQDDDEGPAGEVLWQLGPGLDFRLENGEWFWGQHAPEVAPDGTILIYDNGLLRPGSQSAGGTGTNYSRAVVYRLDRSGPPSSWTARQVWEHRVTEPDGRATYADFLGDADAIGGGNVLITHGSVVDPASGQYSGRVIEVNRPTGAVVFDLRVLVDRRGGWRTYRAEHLDTLYPTDPDAFFPPDPPLP